MSPNDDDPEKVKKGRISYLWLGYGGYPSGGDPAAFQSTNVRSEPGILKMLLKFFGFKEKKDRESKKNSK